MASATSANTSAGSALAATAVRDVQQRDGRAIGAEPPRTSAVLLIGRPPPRLQPDSHLPPGGRPPRYAASAVSRSPEVRTFSPRYGPGFGRALPPGNASRMIVRCTIPSCLQSGPVL